MKDTVLALMLSLIFSNAVLAQDATDEGRLEPYVRALQEEGQDPVSFVNDQLATHDLLLFDDALHSSWDAFDFYRTLVTNRVFQRRVKYIFLEAMAVNKQGYIDTYLASDPEDETLLYPAFQDDASGFGWREQTYFDLLHTIYVTNRTLPADQRFEVIAVSNPVYWSEIRTPEDVALFRKSLLGRDYDMYMIILTTLDKFKSGAKGVFLTNTRHAYKNVRRKDGSLYWNTGTFFHQWNPGKTYAIRVHNVSLNIERRKEPSAATVTTTQGLESVSYSWIRMEGGIWDSAFERLHNRPVAIPLDGTAFGEATYVGNHMLDCAEGQTMSDAYDALVFLRPLEEMRESALVTRIYTPAFKKELIRRYHLLYADDQLAQEMAANGAATLEDLIDKRSEFVPAHPLSQARALGPIDAWRKRPS